VPGSRRHQAGQGLLNLRAVLPNLVIIGAAKAGTTSLHHYLDLHPEVAMAAPSDMPEKEMRYFWREDWRQRQAWYESHFPAGTPVRGEATPAYTAYPSHPHVPERMHELIPEAKLIYLVRDPIDRILSHWVQRRADGDRTPFVRYMDDYRRPENPIVCPSLYWTQIEQYLPFYDRAQMLVVDQHDLRVRRGETLRKIFRFIGVDDGFDHADFERERNTRADKFGPKQLTMKLWDPILWPLSRAVPARVRDLVRGPATKLLYGTVEEQPDLSTEMRERLRVMLAPEVKSLREFTGQPFASWSL
jgi:hypothetical protein